MKKEDFKNYKKTHLEGYSLGLKDEERIERYFNYVRDKLNKIDLVFGLCIFSFFSIGLTFFILSILRNDLTFLIIGSEFALLEWIFIISWIIIRKNIKNKYLNSSY